MSRPHDEMKIKQGCRNPPLMLNVPWNLGKPNFAEQPINEEAFFH